MEELKKAYAEMILNTAKDAAARVMAAERRSRRLKENLVSTKEEAARMLVRLKQMVDSKARESENSIMNQQTKRVELESQLNEVEGIILNLREELYKARLQLSESKKKKLSSLGSYRSEEICDPTPSEASATHELLTFAGSIADIDWKDVNGSCIDQDQHALCQGSVILPEHSVAKKLGCDATAEEHCVSEKITEPVLTTKGCAQGMYTEEISLLQEFRDTSSNTTMLTNIETLETVGNFSLQEDNDLMRKYKASSVLLQKRNLKLSDDLSALCELDQSHRLKRPRQALCSSSSEIETGEDQSNEECKTGRGNNPDGPKYNEKHISVDSVVPEYSGLKDILAKQDELSAMAEFTCSSSINCTEGSSYSGEDDNTPFPTSTENGIENGHSGVQDSTTQLEQIAEQLISLSGGSSMTPLVADTHDIEVD